MVDVLSALNAGTNQSESVWEEVPTILNIVIIIVKFCKKNMSGFTDSRKLKEFCAANAYTIRFENNSKSYFAKRKIPWNINVPKKKKLIFFLTCAVLHIFKLNNYNYNTYDNTKLDGNKMEDPELCRKEIIRCIHWFIVYKYEFIYF